MKNRIWKKILAVGVSLLAEAGMLVGCTAQPAVAYGAETEGGLSVAQDAAWTDLQKFQAVISVKADGLASLTWENENQEYESGDENLFSSGNQDGSLENDQYDFSDETIPHPTSYELVVWLSEYFQPDASFMAPEGCLKEELPIETADGRSSSITGFRWKINPGEQGKQLKIPVTLRDEYRFPAEKHTVPTCQDILHANGAISGEENGGGVYIVKKVENEKNILCKALSKSLEIPAAYMDFSVEMEAKEKALYTGKRIHMAVNLTNNGQVPFYKISLQAKVKEQELVPVWEKEPGLEVSESGAVLESLSAGETRILSFYIDPDMDQKSNLELELFAKTENPVSLEKAAEKQLNTWMKEDFGAFNIEIHYSKIIPHLITCEEYLGDNITDYKFFCFNGEPKFIYVSNNLVHDRQAQIGFFNLDGSKMPLKREDYTDIAKVELPDFFNEMLGVAKDLCKGFPFVRVDFFLANDRYYFAELTFTPSACMMPFNPDKYDMEWGKMIELVGE